MRQQIPFRIDFYVRQRVNIDRRARRSILIKPSKYAEDGFVERFWRGFIPNSTLSYMYSMTLAYIEETGANIELFAVDEYGG